MITVQTLTSQVYERMLQMIVTGELIPGSSLRESDLAARLGVSRTPVREALHRLEEYGLVAMRPNHGAVVRRPGARRSSRSIRSARRSRAWHASWPGGGSRRGTSPGSTPSPRRPGGRTRRTTSRPSTSSMPSCTRRSPGASGNPLLAREIVKLHRMSMLVHDGLESALMGERRISPGERDEARGMFWRQHVAILDELRSGSRSGSRRAMAEHLRACCAYRTRLIAPPQAGAGDRVDGPPPGPCDIVRPGIRAPK